VRRKRLEVDDPQIKKKLKRKIQCFLESEVKMDQMDFYLGIKAQLMIMLLV